MKKLTAGRLTAGLVVAVLTTGTLLLAGCEDTSQWLAGVEVAPSDWQHRGEVVVVQCLVRYYGAVAGSVTTADLIIVQEEKEGVPIGFAWAVGADGVGIAGGYNNVDLADDAAASYVSRYREGKPKRDDHQLREVWGIVPPAPPST